EQQRRHRLVVRPHSPYREGPSAPGPLATSERLVRQAIATRRAAAPERTPSAPIATAAASACDVSTPDVISAAAPAPICVAAPAGPIGSAAAAAPAHRKRSASGIEKPTPRPPRSRKHAAAR